jgi:hypothetical protein
VSLSSTTSLPETSTKSGTATSLPVIIGASVGGVLGLVIIILIIVCVAKKMKGKSKRIDADD